MIDSTTSSVFADAELTPEEEAYARGMVPGATEQTPAATPPAETVEQPGEVIPGAAKNPEAPAEAKKDGEPTEEEGEDDEDMFVRRERDPRTGRFTKWVPHKALHKERETHKKTKEHLEAERIRFARAEERLNTLLQVANKPEAEAKADPKTPETPKNPFEEPDIDPVTDLMGAQAQDRRRQKWLAEQLQTTTATTEQRHADQMLRSAYIEDARRFLAQEPAFKDAWTFLVDRQHKVLEARGIADKAQRDRMIAQEERAIYIDAFHNKKSPAEVIWQLAQAHGFTKPSANAANGAARAAPASQHEQNVRVLEQQKRGMAASVSMSRLGVSAGSLTMAQIADMSQEDFDRLVDEMGGERAFLSRLG